MALINCSRCKNEVSDKAELCPGCGAPITERMQTRTVQKTSRKINIQSVISVLLIVIGDVWIITAPKATKNELSAVPVFLIFIGIIWYLINRFRDLRRNK